LVTCIDPETVGKFEGEIEEAIVEVIVRTGVKCLPLPPSKTRMPYAD
jgi:hypothetical protein